MFAIAAVFYYMHQRIQAFVTMLITIMQTIKTMKPAERTVVVIASHLGLSKIMPIMPNINDTGTENNMSNPPRTGRGLPQPGLRIQRARITAPAIAMKTAESLPKSIISPSLNIWKKTFRN